MLMGIAAIIWQFLAADASSHSLSDTLLNFAPRAVGILIIIDILTRLTGAYPPWWRRRHVHTHALRMALWAVVVICMLAGILIALQAGEN